LNPAEELRRLDEEARRHKREAARHRRLAQEARRRQAQLEEECRRLGIAVTTAPVRGAGGSHGNSRTGLGHAR